MYVTSACVLHNLCILCNDEVQAMLENAAEVDDPNRYPPLYQNAAQGVQRRDNLMSTIYQGQ